MAYLLPFLLVCTVSFPPFITPQYTQLLPLSTNFILVFIAIKSIPIPVKSFFGIILGCVFLLLSSLLIHGAFDSLVYSYIFAALLFSIGYLFASNYNKIQPNYIYLLVKATAFIPFVILLSIILDYLFPGVLDLLKSNSSLSGEYLALRSKSGILPEPSFIGPICSLSYLFLTCQLLYINVSSSFSYSATYYKVFSFLCSVISVVISISPSSVISAVGYFSVALILGGEINYFITSFFKITRFFKIKINFLYLLVLSLSILAFISIFFLTRSSSRIGYIIGLLFSGQFTLNLDESIIDRSLSTIFGITTVFTSPFGFGVNGFKSALTFCLGNPLISFLNIDCTLAVSTRNHNLIANYLQDFGLFGVFYILYCAKLIRFTFKKIHFVTLAFLFVGLVTPNMLVCPLFWYNFSFLSFMPQLLASARSKYIFINGKL